MQQASGTFFFHFQDHLADSSEENEDLLENKTQRMRKYLVFNLLDSERCYYDCLDMVKKVFELSLHYSSSL